MKSQSVLTRQEGSVLLDASCLARRRKEALRSSSLMERLQAEVRQREEMAVSVMEVTFCINASLASRLAFMSVMGVN